MDSAPIMAMGQGEWKPGSVLFWLDFGPTRETPKEWPLWPIASAYPFKALCRRYENAMRIFSINGVLCFLYGGSRRHPAFFAG